MSSGGKLKPPLKTLVTGLKVNPVGIEPTTDHWIDALPIASNVMFTGTLVGNGVATVVISGLPGVIVKATLCLENPAAFVARISNSLVPTLTFPVVPIIAPVVASSAIPGGSEPFSIDHVTGVLLSAVNMNIEGLIG